MEQTSFPVEYDFKTTKLDFVDKKTGKIKDKYKCLPLMITLPITQPLVDPGPPIQTDPEYKRTVVKSTNTINGWLNFVPVDNKQLNIITVTNNILFINKFDYNYDITVDVIKRGKDNVNLRFMAQNPFSLLASNMNGLNLDETVFTNISNGQQIKFTITGQYQFFYVNYPTTDFYLNIIITVSDAKTPIYICKSNCIKCNKCTCFDIKGNGYIKIKDKNIPVYSNKISGNLIVKYFYPEFGYLRDLFYNITLANSLRPPEEVSVSLIKNPIIKLSSNPQTTLTCALVTNLWIRCVIKEDGKLVTLEQSIITSTIYENKLGNYRYSWENSEAVLGVSGCHGTNECNVPPAPFLNLWYWAESRWNEFPENKRQQLVLSGRDDIYYKFKIVAGTYENISSYKYLSFGIYCPGRPVVIYDTFFDITVSQF